MPIINPFVLPIGNYVLLNNKAWKEKLLQVRCEHDNMEAQLHLYNDRPGIFHFSNNFTRNQPKLVKDIDEVISNKSSVFNLPAAFNVISSNQLEMMFFAAKTGESIGSTKYNTEVNAKLLSKICAVYGIDQNETEADMASKDYYKSAFNTYKEYFKNRKPFNHAKLLTLLQELNHMLNTGAQGKSGFIPDNNRELISDFGFDNLCDVTYTKNILKVNNPEFVEDYLTIIKRVEEVAKAYRVENNSFKHKFGAWLNSCFDDEKAKLLQTSPTMEKFLELYLSVGPLRAKSVLEESIKNLVKMYEVEGSNPYEVAAYAHQAVVGAHAFEDANGRTARLLMDLILAKYNIKPIIFYSNKDYTTQVKRSLKTQDHKSFARYLEFLNNQRYIAVTFYLNMQKRIDAQPNFIELREEFDEVKKDLPKYGL